ncbi:MAG: hypothetical protein JXR96_00755 [Deltaproteobacteria bacterium]|nr:hypothetical protein [Deltaproteobacteria bacterium]
MRERILIASLCGLLAVHCSSGVPSEPDGDGGGVTDAGEDGLTLDGGETDAGPADAEACESAAGLCARLGLDCGEVTRLDACGNLRTVFCGTCQAPEVCGGGGANVCGPGSCVSSGWCWENPLPQGNTLRGVDGISDSDLWAVGEGGMILHWNGTNWTIVESGVRESLADVWVTSADDAWAVGTDGTVLHWDGAGWSPVSTGFDDHFEAVAADGQGRVWIAGREGMLCRDGGVWSQDTSHSALQDIWLRSPDEVWAVGSGTIIRFDGQRWNELDSGLDVQPLLSGVWGASGDDVWVVGDYHNQYDEATILHWDGAQLSRVASHTGGGLQGVWGTGADDVLAGGNGGTVVHWDGTSWQDISGGCGGAGAHLYATGGGASQPWFVGNSGQMCRWNGVELVREQTGVSAAFMGIWALGADDAWAVGGPVVLRWNGSTWTETSLPGSGSYGRAVWAASADDVWVVGTHIYHFDGSAWDEPVACPGLEGISGRGPDDVWAVGRWSSSGAAVMHWDGERWNDFAPLSSILFLRDVIAFSGTDVWAVGDGLAHYDGESWSLTDTDSFLHGVWGTSSDDIWAVGERGTVLHWQGAEWTPVDLQTTEGLSDVWGSASDDVWIAGRSGTVFHWDGVAWDSAYTSACSGVAAISGAGTSDVWISGYGSILMHLKR